MAVPTYTKSGAKSTTPAKLPAGVFGEKDVNHQLLKDAYLAYLANGRVNLAVTKKRGEVSGGGRKPWRQKGTGRARFGSSRNPIWTGGGVAFGPSGNENYSRKVNLKARRLALKQVLSLAASQDRLKVIEVFEVNSGKTKDALKLLDKLNVSGQTVIVAQTFSATTERALANLAKVSAKTAERVVAFDVMNADTIVIDSGSLAVLKQRLGGQSE